MRLPSILRRAAGWCLRRWTATNRPPKGARRARVLSTTQPGVCLVAVEGGTGLIFGRLSGGDRRPPPPVPVRPHSAAAVQLLLGCRRPSAIRPSDFGLPYVVLRPKPNGPSVFFGPQDDVSVALVD